MRHEPFLDAWGGGSPPCYYVVRVWVRLEDRPGHWATEDWKVSEAGSVADVIEWARRRSGPESEQVFAVGDSGEAILLWGAEPSSAATAYSMNLHSDECLE